MLSKFFNLTGKKQYPHCEGYFPYFRKVPQQLLSPEEVERTDGVAPLVVADMRQPPEKSPEKSEKPEKSTRDTHTPLQTEHKLIG